MVTDRSGNVEVIPNSVLNKTALVRLEAWEISRVDVPIKVGCNADLEAVRTDIITTVTAALGADLCDCMSVPGETVLTGSMVNNYVKLKLIPAPEKKRYSRDHVAYLVFVCSLKRVFSIAQVQQLIGLGREADVDLEQSYDEMCRALEEAMAARFPMAAPVPVAVHLADKAGAPVSPEVSDLLQAALSALADKVYVEQLIALDSQSARDAKA